jgi:hypothetical protein
MPMLKGLLESLRPVDRLARVEALTLLLQGSIQSRSFWTAETNEQKAESQQLREQLFELMPSRIRAYDLDLPIASRMLTADGKPSDRLERVRKLLSVRFPEVDSVNRESCKYELRLQEGRGEKGVANVTVELAQRADGAILATETGAITPSGEGYEALLNRFLGSAFHHRRDPPAEPVPRLELFDQALEDK